MSKPAIEVRAISELLLTDRELMTRWKRASQAGAIQAVTHEQRNYAVVDDGELLSYLTGRYSNIVVHQLTLPDEPN